jgi:hypothetical protein
MEADYPDKTFSHTKTPKDPEFIILDINSDR